MKPEKMILTTPSGEIEPVSRPSVKQSIVQEEEKEEELPANAVLKTLVFHFESTLAAVKICKKGEEIPQNHDFKFAVPMGKAGIVTIYIQMR